MSRRRSGRHRAWVAVGIALLLLIPGAAWPWGRMGHRVSGMMAESRLTPAALAAVRSLLEPGETLADASTWADEQREVPKSGPWHYVNVPISEPRYEHIRSRSWSKSLLEAFHSLVFIVEGHNELV